MKCDPEHLWTYGGKHSAIYKDCKVFVKSLESRKLKKNPDYFNPKEDNIPKLSQPSAGKNLETVKQSTAKTITDPQKRAMLEVIQKGIILLSTFIQAITNYACSRKIYYISNFQFDCGALRLTLSPHAPWWYQITS